ncbi:hypothetical protein ACP70R_033909 [Stipagrostis hirtigluma subsp. patula]
MAAPCSLRGHVPAGAAARRAPRAVFASAADAAAMDSVLRAFCENRIISGLQNFDRSSVASVVTAADKICVSSVDPAAFHSTVQAGAKMVEIGKYDSFHEMGIEFTSGQLLKLTRETRKMLPDITLSVTVPHTLSLPDQMRLLGLVEKVTLAAAY